MGAISLVVLRGARWSRRCAPTTCRSSAAATPTTRCSPRPVASRSTTRSGSPASASARSTRSSSTSDQVKVTFKVDDAADFGTDTRAAIKVKTILGSMFLALEPAGGGQLEEDGTIPAERTSSPFDVVEAFEGLASTSEQIDTDQLAESLTTLADLTRNTPDEFRGALSRPEPALGQRRGQGRAAQLAAGQPRAGLDGPRRARPGHHRADGGQRRAVPGARRPPRRRPRAAGVHHDALQGAHRARSASRARTSRRPWRTWRTWSRSSTRTRTTSTAACG